MQSQMYLQSLIPLPRCAANTLSFTLKHRSGELQHSPTLFRTLLTETEAGAVQTVCIDCRTISYRTVQSSLSQRYPCLEHLIQTNLPSCCTRGKWACLGYVAVQCWKWRSLNYSLVSGRVKPADTKHSQTKSSAAKEAQVTLPVTE